MITAQQALERLWEGNRRFVSNLRSLEIQQAYTRRGELVAGQRPFAVVLGCADSRVPIEAVFDRGPGDLFVVRVAGNVVTPPQLGSIEFAAAEFGTPLVVVLGHSQCGAVAATVDHIAGTARDAPPNLLSIVEAIRPAVEPLLALDPRPEREELIHRAGRANVRGAVERLRAEPPVLAPRVEGRSLVVVGAEYSLETGEVDFFDGVTDPAA